MLKFNVGLRRTDTMDLTVEVEANNINEVSAKISKMKLDWDKANLGVSVEIESIVEAPQTNRREFAFEAFESTWNLY